MKVLSFDIGGTFVKYGICNVSEKNGDIKIIQKGRFKPSNKTFPSGTEVFENIAKFAKKLLNSNKIECICCGVGGIVNTDNFKVLSVSPKYKDYQKTDIKGIFAKHCDCPVRIINDVKAAALGELRHGCLKGKKNVFGVFLIIGTGIAAAPIIHNKLFLGKSFASGESGPMVVNNHYFENHYSVPSLIKRCQEIDASIVTAENCLEKMVNNAAIKNIVDAWYVGLVEGVSTFVYLFNPEYFIFGGGITEHRYFDLKIFKKLMLKNCRQPPLSNLIDVKLVKARLGNDAGIYGAASLAFDKNYSISEEN